jgi:hypothetical protein
MVLKYCSFIICLILCCNSATNVKINILKNTTKYYVEMRNADTVIIYWDNGNSDTTQSYELFYKTFSDSIFTLLKSNIPYAKNPQIVIRKSDIHSSDSVFYFAIRAVYSYGKSAFHYSFDSTTVPAGGWFLLWSR